MVKTANQSANEWCKSLQLIDPSVSSRVTACVLYLEKCSLTDQINEDVVKHVSYSCTEITEHKI